MSCAGAAAWQGKGPVFLPRRQCFSGKPPSLGLSRTFPSKAGGLYIGISHFTDMQPCYEKGIFLFLEMRS